MNFNDLFSRRYRLLDSYPVNTREMCLSAIKCSVEQWISIWKRMHLSNMAILFILMYDPFPLKCNSRLNSYSFGAKPIIFDWFSDSFDTKLILMRLSVAFFHWKPPNISILSLHCFNCFDNFYDYFYSALNLNSIFTLVIDFLFSTAFWFKIEFQYQKVLNNYFRRRPLRRIDLFLPDKAR